MAGLDVSQYEKAVDGMSSDVSMQTLRALYEDANKTLGRLALGLDDHGSELPDLESALLAHQEFLIDLAAKTKGRTIPEIREKVGFLKRVYLDEMHVANYSLTDHLLLSIWSDMGAYA